MGRWIVAPIGVCSVMLTVPMSLMAAGDQGRGGDDLARLTLPAGVQAAYGAAWDEPLTPVFQQAAADYQVPQNLLLVLGWLGSAFEDRGGAPTIERGYGVMALRENTLGGDSLALAASLTQASADQLKADPAANIRGAAAVLDAYATEAGIERAGDVGLRGDGLDSRLRGNDGDSLDRQDAGPTHVEAWVPVVERYAGLDKESSQIFASEVYRYLQSGFVQDNSKGEVFQVSPQPLTIDPDSLGPPMAQMQSPDYGPAAWDPAASCNYSTATHGSDTIIIHTIEGSYAGAISWFKNCNSDVSSHYVLAQDGRVCQCVLESQTAWHVGCLNSRSIGLEHEGYASSPSHPTALYNASGALCRDICNRRGVPKSHNGCPPGILGHVDANNCVCGGSHWDPGSGWDWGYFISVVNGTTWSNPPYLFDGGADGWTPGNGSSDVWWIAPPSWGGAMYFDQTGNDCFVYSPTTNISGPYGPQVVNVDFYPQNGNTSAHDMQVFWKTNAENSWTVAKSSAIVNYTAQNSWATVNLSVNNSKWWGQTINQLRLDFDNTNHGNRWIVNHFVLQDALWWHFSSDVMGWSAGHSLTAPWQTSCCSWPGVLVTDQNGPDAYMYSPGISGGGWPYNYLGGVDDWIHVRVYPQSGNSSVHDMAVYWIHSGDGSWNEAKSTHVTYTGQNEWVEVNLPVGLNANWPAAHITQLRLDFDQSNHSNRWIVDAISSEYYGADTASPSVPTNLAATAAAQGQVDLTWTASSDDRGVNGYKIYRDNVQIATSVAASYSDTNCAPATTYTYQVSAYDASGNVSGKSTSDTVTTPAGDTQPPTVPTSLTATAASPTSVQLAWTASTDNVGVAGYDIRRNGTVIGSSTATTYTDSGLTPIQTYTYDVRAKDAAPNYSPWSDPATATTPPLPPVSTVVFSDGFDGSLNNWVQQTENFDYSTGANHGSLTGGGAAYLNAGGKDQMYHAFTRPFAQCKVSGWFLDGKGGWKPSVCGYSYRTGLSLRDKDNAAKVYIDNEIYNAPDQSKYYYRLIGTGGAGVHTAYATRDPNAPCSGVWVHFETAVNPGGPGASPTGTFVAKVTDGAGVTSTTQNLTTDYFANGIGRVTLGLGVTSTNDGYFDDVAFEAMPPGVPTMGAATGVSDTQIRWNFTAADNNFLGTDVADAAGSILSPQWPTSGWLDHHTTSWAETGLTPNTEYARKVRTWNGTLTSAIFSNTVTVRTLAPAPEAGSVTADKTTACVGDSVAWTAVADFGPGKVQYYKYAWDQNATHSFDGSEAVWSSGTMAEVASELGTWYLHVQGFNASDVPNGAYDYSVTAQICEPPTVFTAISRKTHGGAGTFDVDVRASGAVECRSDGPTRILVTFDQPVQGVDGLDNADVTASSGTVSSLSIDGTDLTIDLAGATDAQPLTIGLPGISNTAGQTVTDTLCLGVLKGDVTGDGTVNIFDLVTVRNALNEPVTGTNFRSDITADGSINIFDLVTVRNNLNLSVAPCP